MYMCTLKITGRTLDDGGKLLNTAVVKESFKLQYVLSKTREGYSHYPEQRLQHQKLFKIDQSAQQP